MRAKRFHGCVGWFVAFALCVASSGLASVVVDTDVPEAQLLRGDRILAFRGDDQRWPVSDPLALELAWLQCSASRQCRIDIERQGRHYTRPLWMATVPVAAPDSLGPTPTDADLASLAERHASAGQRSAAAWYRLQQADLALRATDIERARQLARDAREAAGDADVGVFATIEFARMLVEHRQIEPAVALLDELSQTSLPIAFAARVVRQRGALHFQQSELSAAERKLRVIVDRARRESPGSHLLASLVNSLAVVIRPQGRLAESRALFNEALTVAAEFESPSVLAVMITSNLALLERAAGDLPRAEALFGAAMAMLDRLPPQPGLRFDTQANLALVLLDRGRTRDAAALWNQEVPENGEEDQERAGRAQQNLALVFAAQGNPREAVLRLRLAVEYWEKAAPNGIEEAGALLDLGTYSADIGAFDEAHRSLAKALRLYRGIAPMGTGVINTYDALANFALAAGEPERAAFWQRRALRLRDRSDQSRWRRDNALTQLAQALHGQGKHDAALDALAEAEAHAAASGRDAGLANALTLRGEILLALGQHDAARAAACNAVELIESLRGTSPSGAEFRAPFTHLAAPVYRRCMEAALASGDTQAVLAYYQRERRGVLQALLIDRDLRFRELPTALANERGAKTAELQRIVAELETASGEPASDLKRQRDRVRAELRRIDVRIAAAVPSLRPWRADRTRVPDRAPPGHTVVAFAIGATDTLRMVLGAGAPRIDRLPLTAGDLDRRVTAWREALQVAAVDEPSMARTLYDQLLGGIEIDQTLIVVPDGPLHRLPFAALAAPGDRRLIEDRALALAALLPADVPCAPACAEQASLDLLGLADGSGGQGREALSSVDIEVDGLAQLDWPQVKVLKGPAATVDALFRYGSQARRIHFAVHGVNDPTSPMDSALMLRDGPSVQPLAVWRIFEQLRLDAELVVLAACDTAPGLAERDDGWLGLTRAFQFAGAAQVMSALWPVGDRSTAALMASFHRRHAAGESPAAALAQAQREMLGASAANEPVRGVGETVRSSGRPRPNAWAAFHVYWSPEPSAVANDAAND